MNFHCLIFTLIGQILSASVKEGDGVNSNNNIIGNYGTEKLNEEYENYLFIIKLFQDLREGNGMIDLPSLTNKFLNCTLYYHGYSDDEIIMQIKSEENLVEFLMRILIQEMLIDFCRGKVEANPHMMSLIKGLKNSSELASDLYLKEFIAVVEEIHRRNTLDELNEYLILFREKLYYEAFLREPEIDFKRVLKECKDVKFQNLSYYFSVFDGYTKDYKFNFPENNDVQQEIFSKLKIDRLWELKDFPGLYKKTLTPLLKSWIEVSRRAIFFKYSISSSRSEVFMFGENRELHCRVRIAKIINRFSKFLLELRQNNLESLIAQIKGNDISNILTFLLDSKLSYDEYFFGGGLFGHGFKFLAMLGINYSSLEMRVKRINFYLLETSLPHIRKKLFQILRDPLFQVPVAFLPSMSWRDTILFYKILTIHDNYKISQNDKGDILVYHKPIQFLPFWLMDEHATSIFNTFYRNRIFFTHDLNVLREKVVDVLCRKLIERYPFMTSSQEKGNSSKLLNIQGENA